MHPQTSNWCLHNEARSHRCAGPGFPAQEQVRGASDAHWRAAHPTHARCCLPPTTTHRDLVQYRTQPDPFRGDAPQQKVREAAKEALDSLYNSMGQQGGSSSGSHSGGSGLKVSPCASQGGPWIAAGAAAAAAATAGAAANPTLGPELHMRAQGRAGGWRSVQQLLWCCGQSRPRWTAQPGYSSLIAGP